MDSLILRPARSPVMSSTNVPDARSLSARPTQGLVSTVSALLFLGRDTFCVSDKVIVNSRAAHQWCFDWTVGIVVSIVLAAATVVLCIVGFVGALEEMMRQAGQVCIPAMDEEQRCAGSLTDDITKAEQILIQRNDGVPTCVEQSLKVLVPGAYIGIYAFSCIIAVLSVKQGRDFLSTLGDD